jgi:peptidyl-prolyl cis-trans isomerase SurA
VKIKTFVAVSVLLGFSSSIVANVVIVEEIIAKINGDIVMRSEYEKGLQDARGEVARRQDLSDEQRQKFLEEAEKNALRDQIDHRLLIQKAKEFGVSVEAQVLRQRDRMMKANNLKTIEEFEVWVVEQTGMTAEDALDQIRSHFLTQAVIGQEVGSRIIIPRDEIEAYYEEHKQEFMRTEGVRLAEIVISTEGKTGEELAAAEKKAKDTRKRLLKGEPFAEMARRLSDNKQNSEKGGDIGVWRRGKLRKNIEDLVFDQPRGHITSLIEVPNGYLILKVFEKHREGLATLEEVRDEIRNRLSGPKFQPAFRKYLSKLRTDAYIEIRPGYIDMAAVLGKDTSWTDPSKLAPVTTTREEVLAKKKKRRLLWVIPLPGGGKNKKDKDKDKNQADDTD